ncbi:MAG: molybdopterin synthase sulfur carrier subunit [Chitinophagales bacterium]|nr:MAG: molybdopterin synthase sulfur carrier subunit [Chitinophagales bacterium]
MAEIIIPTPLRKFTGNVNKFTTQAKTVGEAINELVGKYPELKEHLLGEDGNIRSFIKVFVGEEDINHLNRSATALDENAVVSIVPAIAGGIK